MDPNATLRRIMELLSGGSEDADEASEALLDLSEWLSRGGFVPTVRVNDRGDWIVKGR